MAEARQYTTAELLEENRWAVGYAIFGVVLFLVFVLVNFPYADAISTLASASGLKVEYRDLRWHFPFGVTLEGVHLSYANGGAAIAQSPAVTLTPSLDALLLLRPGVRIGADFAQGSVVAALSRSGDQVHVRFKATGVELAGYSVPAFPTLQITGKLSGSGSLDLDPANPLASDGSVTLSGKDVRFPLLQGLPDLRFTQASARAVVDHGLVRIRRFDGRGAEVMLSGEGTIRLAPQLSASTVDMILKIQPTARGRTDLAPLLQLLPHPPNPKQPYHLHGPLMMPAIT
jgi:type II secretion system protein N